MPTTTPDGFPIPELTDAFGNGGQAIINLGEFLDDNFTPWTAYTPAIDGLTLGNGTMYAAYRRWLDMVDFVFQLTLGSTSDVTDSMQIEYAAPGLPHGPNVGGISWASAGINGTLLARDSSGPLYRVGALSPSVAGFAYMVFDGSTLGANDVVPWTWAVNDTIQGYGRYQVALA